MTSIGVLSQFSSTDIHMCSQSRHVITSFMFCYPRTSKAVAVNQILIASQHHMLHFADKGYENCPGSFRSTLATSVNEVKSLEILLQFLDQPWRHRCSWSTQNTSTLAGSDLSQLTQCKMLKDTCVHVESYLWSRTREGTGPGWARSRLPFPSQVTWQSTGPWYWAARRQTVMRPHGLHQQRTVARVERCAVHLMNTGARVCCALGSYGAP